ncbi:NADH dehydrogenase [ubiquinone] 1 alpha subcomplex subunit 8 [Trichogramma pretiosum]|uniref:NADH dehydrogenase [ubiquinone] 1 alpha subcomplex subunit 8 n=1 Tax=Trichogramma pretiosum TaxID=7493 RepID=UPI0006C9DE07|nr:NADH dehydrogenase [ubiquinone] 1 alpha subcomplex subunit 8 [Trichogramma pretiosum]XP_023318619.1 NADH dehydrogenase [ubiquinone] 1 alpha subcomplex subunit 8 [Trichogramma pretiosum]
MVLTDKFDLPTIEELTVPEINLTFPTLQAAAHHLGKYCEWKNHEFMLCKVEEEDPRKCVKEGKDVTACSLEFFQKIKKHCRKEFDQYANCIDKSSGSSSFAPCRKTQSVFDKCVLDNLGQERPGYGYFCEAKVHETSRPKPTYNAPEFPNAAVPMSTDEPLLPPRYGSRRVLSAN